MALAPLGRRVINRCNPTVLFERGQEETAGFLADQGVEIVASLPCYSRENGDRQRGRGVFDGSVEGLRLLNRLGYARGGSSLRLDLVYNPQGPSLPPAQTSLAGPEATLWDLDDLRDLEGRPIATAEHCFGCTAGSGSSRGGELT